MSSPRRRGGDIRKERKRITELRLKYSQKKRGTFSSEIPSREGGGGPVERGSRSNIKRGVGRRKFNHCKKNFPPRVFYLGVFKKLST